MGASGLRARGHDRRNHRVTVPLAELLGRYAQTGTVRWIGLRAKRLEPMSSVSRAYLDLDGLDGDHARPGKRAVTFIQQEHLPVIAALAGLDAVAPGTLRRNIVISGLNLGALRGKALSIGDAVVELTTPCAPCSRLEAALGHGGYNVMRGHGGWCAAVIEPGEVALNAKVTPA